MMEKKHVGLDWTGRGSWRTKRMPWWTLSSGKEVANDSWLAGWWKRRWGNGSVQNGRTTTMAGRRKRIGWTVLLWRKERLHKNQVNRQNIGRSFVIKVYPNVIHTGVNMYSHLWRVDGRTIWWTILSRTEDGKRWQAERERERERERDSDVYYMNGDDVLRYLFSLGMCHYCPYWMMNNGTEIFSFHVRIFTRNCNFNWGWSRWSVVHWLTLPSWHIFFYFRDLPHSAVIIGRKNRLYLRTEYMECCTACMCSRGIRWTFQIFWCYTVTQSTGQPII